SHEKNAFLIGDPQRDPPGYSFQTAGNGVAPILRRSLRCKRKNSAPTPCSHCCRGPQFSFSSNIQWSQYLTAQCVVCRLPPREDDIPDGKDCQRYDSYRPQV